MSTPRVDLRASLAAVRAWLASLPSLPWATLGLAGIMLLALPMVELGFVSKRVTAHDELRDAVSLFIRHPMLEIHPRLLPVLQDEMPGYEGNQLFDFMARDEKGRAQQAELDALVERAFARLDAHPSRALGVVPAAPLPWGFGTHVFVHAGWLHGIASIALLLLFGPLLERTWGRVPFVAITLGAAVVGAGVFTLAHRGVDRPLIGASACVAALAVAIAVRFRQRELNLIAWLEPLADVELRAPAWSAALVGVGYEAALWWIVRSPGWTSIDAAVGYTGHAVAAGCGGLAAFLFARFGIEERFGAAPPEEEVRPATPVRRFDLDRVVRLRQRGEVDRAFALLLEETSRSARNRDVVCLLWELALERETPDEAVPAMHRLLAEELRRGARRAAVSHWRELTGQGVRPPEPGLLLQLLPSIQEEGDPAEVCRALAQTLEGEALLSPALAGEVAQLAAERSPELAAAAAEQALLEPGLDAERRAALRRLIARVREAEEAPLVVSAPEELPPSPFFEGQDRSAFGDVAEDLTILEDAEPATPARSLQVVEAVPTAMTERGLELLVSGRGASRLDYPRIEAVALAGVRGLGPKPVVLIDLVVDVPRDPDAPLKVVRLRSDSFDPRRLVATAGSALGALRAFASELVKRSGARALTDAGGEPLPVFDSVEIYAADILSFD